MSCSLLELATLVGARLVGPADLTIHAVGTLAMAKQGEISFLTNSRYRSQLATTAASAVILREQDLDLCPVAALVCSNPHAAYARISQLFITEPASLIGIHPSVSIAHDCQIGSSVSIGPNVVLESGVTIGDGVTIGAGCYLGQNSSVGEGSRLFPNTTLYHNCHVGSRARLHSGVVIGSDGFGFANEGGSWIKIAQIGGVVIGDDVEIGANTTVDCGAVEPTVIGNGVKLDNQIQIAHNVSIGDHTIISGCVGVAGSTRIGSHCAIGGGAGILGHLEIVDGVTITATSLVTKSIPEPGVYSSGTPLQPNDQWQRNFARFKQLDSIAKRLKNLEKSNRDKG